MILLTGAAGFIGSCFLTHLNKSGHENIIICDDFSSVEKRKNIAKNQYRVVVHRDQLFDWLTINGAAISYVFHLGARTDTTEKNRMVFDELNLNYSKRIWRFCVDYKVPLIYASSAATYGLGELGFEDNHLIIKELKPLNPYGKSKNEFDKWALKQKKQPPQWQGFKFFNVYGPNEYHKGRMASVIFHTYNQIKQNGQMKLFKSHRVDFQDGQQSRDFIYVKDILKVLYFFFENSTPNGLFNLGTGVARSFWDLAVNTFLALNLDPKIIFIDTPLDIRATYQYFTEANINKLRSIGYNQEFYSLEDGVKDYVKRYLSKNEYY